ncbi:MAG: hypothetical protein Q7R97_05120 [Candidatus Daviesbacteria bacterium]|nr:hypothetical protein [Candidatus Daviesbacteria bacterium]
MNKKTFIIFLVLSVGVTYGVAFLQFATGNLNNGGGLPFSFSSFNFLGSETNTGMLILDIIFWFVILFGIWKLMGKLFKR